MNPILMSKITLWRAKAAEGTLSEEEMIEAVKLIREGRISAATTAKTVSKAKALVEIPKADDLLDELGGI